MMALICVAFVVGLGFLFGAFDAYEAFYSFTRFHESWELDDIVLMIPGALLVLVVVAWRRGVLLRREMRQRILAEQEVEKALAAAVRQEEIKKEFMIHVSHELNGPVNGIMGMLQLLAAEDDPLQAKVDIDLALASTRSLKQIISSVITFVELDKGDVAAGHEPVSIRELLAGCLDGFRPLAREKGIALAGEVDPSTPERIRVHEALLQLVIDNLISNAVKYTDKGRVDVAMRYEAMGGELVLEVADTGHGIAREEQEKVFARYYRTRGSSWRTEQGMGLGLSLLRQALEMLGGRVEVSSEPGVGSRFMVAIPVQA